MWNIGRRRPANECFGAYPRAGGGGRYRLLGIRQAVKGVIESYGICLEVEINILQELKDVR